MRVLFVVMLASGLCLAGCGQAADRPVVLDNPVGPSLITGSGSAAAQASGAKAVEVPFHSEITWTKVVNGGVPDPCQGLHGNPPEGMVYLMRNTSEGPAVSTHLGAGDFQIRTCVYGTGSSTGSACLWGGSLICTGRRPTATCCSRRADFLYWTGTAGPLGGQSTA